jgi:hypothetical protein
MILEKKKILFVHIEKTGGNSLVHVFKKYSNEKIFKHNGYSDGSETFEIKGKYTLNKHQNLADYKKMLGSKISKFKIITFVRNPLDRLISAYFMRDRSLHPNFFVRKINHFTKKRFDFFLFNHKFYKNKIPEFSLNTFKLFIKDFNNQTSYFKINKKFIQPNYLLRFENYKCDLKKICKIYNIKFKHVHVNKSVKKKFTNDKLKTIEKLVLSSHHREDYNTFGYKKLI